MFMGLTEDERIHVFAEPVAEVLKLLDLVSCCCCCCCCCYYAVAAAAAELSPSVHSAKHFHSVFTCVGALLLSDLQCNAVCTLSILLSLLLLLPLLLLLLLQHTQRRALLLLCTHYITAELSEQVSPDARVQSSAQAR
jgi:streptolysin S family bacteriocin protoxin